MVQSLVCSPDRVSVGATACAAVVFHAGGRQWPHKNQATLLGVMQDDGSRSSSSVRSTSLSLSVYSHRRTKSCRKKRARQSSVVSLGSESDAYECGDVTCVRYNSTATRQPRLIGRGAPLSPDLSRKRLGMTRVFRPAVQQHTTAVPAD